MSNQLDQFLALIVAFQEATGLAEATISTRALKDGKRIGMIRSGRDIGVRRLDEAIQWFSDNWPRDAVWPADIPRPNDPAPPSPLFGAGRSVTEAGDGDRDHTIGMTVPPASAFVELQEADGG